MMCLFGCWDSYLRASVDPVIHKAVLRSSRTAGGCVGGLHVAAKVCLGRVESTPNCTELAWLLNMGTKGETLYLGIHCGLSGRTYCSRGYFFTVKLVLCCTIQ